MNKRIGCITIMLVIVVGCASPRHQERVTASLEEREAMKSILLENIPPGTSLEAAQEFMEGEGFKCRVVRNGDFAEQGTSHDDLDFVYCDRQDQIDMWVHRRWQIAIVVQDDRVCDVLVSVGNIGL